MNFLGMGPLELVVILALALVIFGPDKLPEIGQQVGRAVREIRRMSSEVTDEIQKSMDPDRPTGPKPPGGSVSRPTLASPPEAPPSPPPPQARPQSAKESDIEPPY